MDDQHQLETELSNQISSLYKTLTGHSVILTDCHVMHEHHIALVLENLLTPVELLLLDAGLGQLANSLRYHIDDIFHHHLSSLVQQITRRIVIDILSESRVETQRQGIILVLEPKSSSARDYSVR